MRRRPAEARAWLDQTNLPPAVRSAHEAEYNASVAEGQQLVAAVAARTRQHLHAIGSEGYELSVAARDDARALAADIRSGRIPVNEVKARLDDLTGRIAGAAERRSSFESEADSLAEIEADPSAWIDRLYQTFPSTRPDYSF